MSLKATKWAHAQRGIGVREKLILLDLADRANTSKGERCWPSLQRIAERAMCSRRQAQRCVLNLAEAGLIEITPHFVGGRQTQNRYRLRLDRGRQAEPQGEGDASDTLPSDQGDTGVRPPRDMDVTPEEDIAVTPEPLRGTPQKEPTPLPPARLAALAEYRPPFEGESFLAALASFLQHRKEIRKQVKPDSETWRRLRNKLERWGESDSTAALVQTVENAWTGVFEPKGRTAEGQRSNVVPMIRGMGGLHRPSHHEPTQDDTRDALRRRIRRVGAS